MVRDTMYSSVDYQQKTGVEMDMSERTRLKHESESRDGCQLKTTLEKRLIIFMFIAIAIGIAILVILAGYYKSEFTQTLSKIKTKNICLSKECITTASSLLQWMDTDQKPCDNFYSFVCGNWIKNSHLVGQNVISQFTRLNTIITLRVKEFLELERSNLTEHEKKIKEFYGACLKRESRDKAATKELLGDLRSFGGWPMIEKDWDSFNFSWGDLVGQLYEKGYPHDTLLSISVDIDIKNTSTSLLVVDQPSLGLNDRGYFLLSKDKVISNYQNLIYNLAHYLHPDIDLNKTAHDVRSAVAIEKKLAKLMTDREKDPNEFYNIMTLVEIEEFAPVIPWRTLLRRLLPPEENITNNTRLMVVVPDTLKGVNDLLEELDNPSGKEQVVNYMLYRAVLFAAEHLGKDVFILVEENMHHANHRELWQLCVPAVVDFFHMSLTATYAESYMDTETKSLLEMMFQDIQATLLDDIKSAQWLDEKTKQRAALKVTKARSTIAYRDEMLDAEKLNEYYKPVEVVESHFTNIKTAYKFYSKERMIGLSEKRIRFKWTDTNNLLTANAFYQPSQNSIIVPIGLLQDTFFQKGRPNYVNYGSLGTILGHEYTHAFDSTGSLYDEEGNYYMWWTNQSWNNFQGRTQCYVDQYNEYYEPRVKAKINGTLTLSENIADNGGLLAAYHAYIKLLKRIGKEQKLPGLNFTEKQMFWISFASAWCRKQTNHSLQYSFENSVHSPSKFRVIGALSNIKEFSHDFSCKKGSPLNPLTKCHLWE